MGQIKDRIPWWLIMIGIWATIIAVIVGIFAASVWLGVWLVNTYG